jgi:hypothetical protein
VLLLLLLLLLKMLGVLLLGMLRMLGVLLHLLRVLLRMLLLRMLLGVGSRRVRDLLRRCWALSLSRGGRRSLSRGRLLLLLLRWCCRLWLLGMSHRRLDRRSMMLRLTGLGRRWGAIRSEVALFLLASSHVGLGVMLCAIPVGMVSELCLRLLLLLLLLLLRRCLLQRRHRRRLLLTLPCLHVAGPRALLHRRWRREERRERGRERPR